MTSSLTGICFLDTPSLVNQQGKQRLHLRYRKALGLLSFLAAENNRNHSRAYIASLFWPDLDESAARINLRQCLSALTKLLQPTPFKTALVVNREFIALHEHPQLRFDIHQLEYPAELEQAEIDESLLTGVFMAGYYLTDCEEFESWLEDKRNYYRNCQIKLLTQLLNHAQTKHKSDQVITLTTKLLKIDPDNEALLCDAMKICNDYGQPQLALKLYEHFSQRIQRDLGATPNETSRSLYQQIMSLSQKAVVIPSHSNQFPAIEKIAPVVVVHLQWRCLLKDTEAIAQSLYDADCYSRKILCEEINAFHQSSAGRGAYFYFGWPNALDDNAWLAIRGTLRLMEYATHHSDLALKAAIHTGTLLSSIKNAIPDLLGDITEETGLLCQSANDGQILLSGPCYQLVDKRIGARKLIENRRHIDGSLQASYLLTHPNTQETDEVVFDYPEMSTLYQQLDQIYRQAVNEKTIELSHIIAPSGAGKSTQVMTWLAGRSAEIELIKLNCYPDRQAYPLFPFISGIRQLLSGSPDQVLPTTELESLLITRLGHKNVSFSSLSLAISSNQAPSRLASEKICHDLTQLFNQLATRPLVIWIEDAHWIDEASHQYLATLGQQLCCSTLVIMTAQQLPFPLTNTLWKPINIQAPGTASAAQLVRFFHPEHLLPVASDRIARIVSLANGNIFLLKQLSKADEHQIPLAIQHYFSFALDQLSSQREEILQQHLQGQACKQKSLICTPMLALTLESLTPKSHLNHLNRALAEQALTKRKSAHQGAHAAIGLAYNWLKCNELIRAENLFEIYAEQALTAQNHTCAASYFQQLLKIHQLRGLEKHEQYIQRILKMAECRIQAYGLGDPIALSAALEALTLCHDLSLHSLRWQCISFVIITLQYPDFATARLELALRLPVMAATPAQMCESHVILAYAHLLNQQTREAQAAAHQAVSLSSSLALTDQKGLYGHLTLSSLILLGISYLGDDDDASVQTYAHQIIELEKHSTPSPTLSEMDRCRALLFASLLISKIGKHISSQAVDLTQRGLKLAQQLQQPQWIAIATLLKVMLDKSATQKISRVEIDSALDTLATNFHDCLDTASLTLRSVLDKKITTNTAIRSCLSKKQSTLLLNATGLASLLAK